VPAGIGLAGGAIALVAATAQRFAAEGRHALLVREDTLTADIAGLAACEGLLTVRGSRTAHAAVLSRQLGKPCLVGCAQLAIDTAARSIALGGQTLHEGDSFGSMPKPDSFARSRRQSKTARGTGGRRNGATTTSPRALYAADPPGRVAAARHDRQRSRPGRAAAPSGNVAFGPVLAAALIASSPTACCARSSSPSWDSTPAAISASRR
jgi:phosphohistidine swiveling domain-containing protein